MRTKNVDYLGLGKEDNPAMGYRAIRICLEQPEIFKTQLRALLRAAKYGTLAIMYPMIISVEEVLDIRKSWLRWLRSWRKKSFLTQFRNREL